MTILCQLLTQRALAAAATELCLGNELLLEGLASLLENPGGLWGASLHARWHRAAPLRGLRSWPCCWGPQVGHVLAGG